MVPLWRQLQAAASVLVAIEQGRSFATAIASAESDLRPGVQALVSEALRCWGLARVLRRILVNRPPAPTTNALLGLTLALASRPDPMYEHHTLVNQAVEAAKRDKATAGHAHFVNACLRRFSRDRAQLVRASQDSLEAIWNLPDWWVAQIQADWPTSWRNVLSESTARPAMTLRVNARRTDAARYLIELEQSGIAGRAQGTHTIVLRHPVPVDRLPGFSDGRVSVQDAGAQMAAPCLWHALTALVPTRTSSSRFRILDACAAPGGKTAHLLELGDAEVTALEIDEERKKRIDQTLQRLSLEANVILGDATKPAAWWDGRDYDAILLDAPCTASGVSRRHPDVPWLRRPRDVTALAGIQAKLLEALWPLLRPGGVLLYCTCSVFRDEGERQIQSFVANNSQSISLPAPGHLHPSSITSSELSQDNGVREHDGFYFALLQKAS